MARWSSSICRLPVIGYVAVVGCATHATSTETATTLCEIRARQEYFDQKHVVVRTHVDGDGHRTIVVDPSCPRMGAQLKFSETALRDGYAAPINEAILQKMSGQPIKSVIATLTGTFSLDRSNGLAAEFIVDRVDDLDIKRGKVNR
jgi:hypothetical protein